MTQIKSYTQIYSRAVANLRSYQMAIKKKPMAKQCLLTTTATKLNCINMEEHGSSPVEVRHVLIDYQNDNEHIVSKVMDRRKAFQLNYRFKGTGMAWAVKTGY